MFSATNDFVTYVNPNEIKFWADVSSRYQDPAELQREHNKANKVNEEERLYED